MSPKRSRPRRPYHVRRKHVRVHERRRFLAGHRRAQRQLRAVHQPSADQNQPGPFGRSRDGLRPRATPQRSVAERSSLQSRRVVRLGPLAAGPGTAGHRSRDPSRPGDTHPR